MMNFNPHGTGARPLGGLQKPGAGAVMATMSVPPEGEIPLRVDLLDTAQSAAWAVIGQPGVEGAVPMLHDYNLLVQTPGYLAGSWNPQAYETRRAILLASIAEIIRSGWGALTEFLIDAQNAINIAVQDALESQTPGGKERSLRILRYFLDELTALGPQVKGIAAELDIAGQLVEDKIRDFKNEYAAANLSLQQMLDSAASLIDALTEKFKEAAEGLKEPVKWATVAVVGLAVVALVGAAVYFIPRPRGRR